MTDTGAPVPPPDDVRPRSQLPSGGLPLPLVALALLIFGVALFVFLEEHRSAERPVPLHGATGEISALPSIPPLQVPPAPPPPPAPAAPAPPPPPPPQIQYVVRPGPSPPPVIQYVERPMPAAQPAPAAPQFNGKLSQPALVVDQSESVAAPANAEDAAARATVLRNRATLVPQGTLIPAVLETPINSTRPGLVRAITSADTRGFDGTRVLIPKGSRLIGECKADVQQGQNRVLVTWNRLVRPDGVAIHISSPASDTLGGTGIAGAVNNHLLARVGSVVLQTALTVGVDLATVPGNGSVVIGAPGAAMVNAGQTLFPTADLKPTITVREGAAITVFVARDLDFGGASPRS